MTYDPPPPPPRDPPGGFDLFEASGPDPRRNTNRVRNIVIAGIIGVALLAVLATCGVKAISKNDSSARNYVTSHYQRQPSLDETDVKAYVATGSVQTVAAEIAKAGKPTDQRTGATGSGNETGTRFLQYPDYMIGVFPYQGNTSKVMVSKDYTSGYNHYHSYVGSYWVPSRNYGGSGSSNRGGGSGSSNGGGGK